MKFELKLSSRYFVDAEDEDDALTKLGDYLDRNNMTAETEFWDNIDIVELTNK